MADYFMSDPHIGHPFVAKIRGFGDDVEAHNSAVARAFDRVKPEDIVWMLGDIVGRSSEWKRALTLLASLPGRKRLICGNHDPVSSIHREAWKYQKDALEVFETVQDFAKIKVGGKVVLLSHYPYGGVGSEGLRGEDGSQVTERYTEFRLTDCGTPLIHGHTHGPEKIHFSSKGTPEIHVGLDAWGMNLVSRSEIEKMLDTLYKPIVAIRERTEV